MGLFESCLFQNERLSRIWNHQGGEHDSYRTQEGWHLVDIVGIAVSILVRIANVIHECFRRLPHGGGNDQISR